MKVNKYNYITVQCAQCTPKISWSALICHTTNTTTASDCHV